MSRFRFTVFLSLFVLFHSGVTRFATSFLDLRVRQRRISADRFTGWKNFLKRCDWSMLRARSGRTSSSTASTASTSRALRGTGTSF